MIEENAALKALQAKLASHEMALARLVDAKRQTLQAKLARHEMALTRLDKMAPAQLVDAKRQKDAESRQADVEDAVREIVASEIKRHHAGDEIIDDERIDRWL